MAAGNFHIRSNAADTSAVPNAGGGNEDANWDTLDIEDGSIVTFTDPNFRLNIGIYLVMYSERFNTTDVTNNERIELQGELHQSGTGVIGGYSQDYIRKTSGQQDCVLSGQQIIEVTANNTDYFIRFYRTDNSTTGTVTRVPGWGGLIVLQLDSAAEKFGLYSKSTTVSSSGTTWVDFTADTNDRQDTGFSNNGSGVITVTTAGRYLATYNLDLNQTGTGREEAQGVITVNGTATAEVGSYSACYLRGADGCQDGALSWIGIIDVAASDTLRVRFGAPLTSVAVHCTSGYFQLWQIPAGADEAIINATTGDQNAIGDFSWDTQPHLDAASFTYINGNPNIDIDQEDFALCFATTAQLAADAPQRPYPIRKFTINDTEQNNMSAGYYHRNSGFAGACSVTLSNLLHVPINNSVKLKIIETATSGTLTNDSGQFSILSLESLYGPYTFPPLISDFNTTEKFNWGDTGLVITGSSFGATQGTGKVEFWSDTVGTIKTSQTVNSWSATSIQIDTVQGSLLPDVIMYLVVTINGGTITNKLEVQNGLIPYNEALLTTSPDHYWRLNNVYTDTGITGPARDMTSAVIGTWTFNASPICDTNTHSLNMNAVTDKREIVDSANMNITITSNERTIAMWLQLNTIQKSLAAIWKEGGGVQNLAFLVGLGNVVLAQGADTPGNAINAQGWSDFKLTTSRPYHIVLRYSLTESPKELRLYIDGVEQAGSGGNPLGTGTFNSHSGDVVWGDPDTNLETGGTDIAYAGMENAQISDFATWSDNSAGTNAGALDKVTEIRDILFRRGAIPDDTIATDTEVAMQTALDATLDARADWPLSYRINGVTGGGNLKLILKNKVFDDRVSAHIEYRGGSTLTLVNAGTSNATSALSFSTTGGTISFVETAIQSFNVTDSSGNAIAGALVNVYQSSDDTEVMAEVTDVNGNAENIFFEYTTDTSIYFRVRSSTTGDPVRYIPVSGSGTITSSGLQINVIMKKDTIQ